MRRDQLPAARPGRPGSRVADQCGAGSPAAGPARGVPAGRRTPAGAGRGSGTVGPTGRDDPWQTDADDGRRLVVAYAADGARPGRAAAAGRVAVAALDRFTEVIPSAEQTTGAAFGFDAPAARAPAGDPAGGPARPRRRRSTRRCWSTSSPRPASSPTPGWPGRPTSTAQFAALLPTALLPATGPTAIPLDRRAIGGGAAADLRRRAAGSRPTRASADLARGFAAEVADPAWLLGRQWQLGEHQGEDASSPVRVDVPRRLDADRPARRPAATWTRGTVPAEAIVESEPGDFWTAGPPRRGSAGAVAAAARRPPGAPLPDDPALLLAGLPAPYDVARRHRPRRPRAVAPARRARAATRPGSASPARRGRRAASTCGTRPSSATTPTSRPAAPRSALAATTAATSTGSVDADRRRCPARRGAGRRRSRATPAGCSYPGAPLPRWWQIEDAQVDIGGYRARPRHFATLLLIDLVVNHSDDWFTFPVDARARRTS